MKVSEIMTKDPQSCLAETSLQEVARLMASRDVGCIPVMEIKGSKRPIGTITDRDITIRSLAEGRNPLDLTAGEIMTDSPLTVVEDATFDECCQTMEDNQIRRVLVVDEKDDCVGIVAQADVARKANEHATAKLVREVSGRRAQSARGSAV